MPRPRAGHAKAVVVCDLQQARAALQAGHELGVPVALLSLPHGAASVGAGWFKAVVESAQAAFPAAAARAILDCGDRPDLAQAAFRHGLKDVCFSGPPAVRRKLAEIAAQFGARLHPHRPPALELNGAADPLAACRAWLAAPSPESDREPSD
jgi:hypothetical protein